MADQQSRVSPQQDLIALIESWDLNMGSPLDADTPLIGSGLFDSLALFNLLAWIEQRVGAPIDPTALDLVKEWDTVNDIVRFVERQRGRGRER